MPRGGSRPGAGRKPRDGARGVVLGLDGKRVKVIDVTPVAPPAPTEAARGLADPPPDLPDAQRALWTLYAPHAIEQLTLVPETVAGFRELVEQLALKQAIAARIEKVKPASRRGEGLLKTYVKLAQRLDSTLARFKLTSFGKAMTTGKKTTAASPNPWAQVASR